MDQAAQLVREQLCKRVDPSHLYLAAGPSGRVVVAAHQTMDQAVQLAQE